ncbi:MAG: anaerobic glycerol-3-phosphate dehydrogenase subunit C [Rhodospirillales bacterium]|nr:anaerobic glycerol-3-phosphate dehydrogenase subunit C [Rhodospirillales bacterium]
MPETAKRNSDSTRSDEVIWDSAAVLRSMDQCTKCGICHAHCPVAAATGEFPGPKYTGPQAQRFRIIGSGHELSPILCSGCGVCTSVCPNNVAITDIITLAKAEIGGHGTKIGIGQKLVNRPELVGRLSGVFPWLTNALLANSLVRRIVELVIGIHRKAPLPKVHGRKFDRWFADLLQPDGTPISFFTGCAIGNYDPDVGIAMVRVLNHLGYKVDVPTDLCCSLPMLSSGETDAARPRARALVDALQPAATSNKKIISTSTSCSLTLRSKYAAFLDMTDHVSRNVANATVDACEFLLHRHVGQLRNTLHPIPLKVLYHGPCQLRGHQMGQPAVELLRLIPGINLEVSEADCCGIGGTYGYDKDKYDIAMSVGKTLIDQVKQVRPDVIVCDSETCRWNIEAQTSIKTIHPVQMLMRALDAGD